MIDVPGQRPLTVKRPAAGSVVDHRFVSGADTTFTILGHVTDVTPTELVQTLQLDSTRTAHYIETATELRTANESTGTGPDVVVVRGEDCEVHKAERLDDAPGAPLPHWLVMVVRRERT